MKDQQAEAAILAALDLAVILRDQVGQEVADAAQLLLDRTDGDPIAAVCIAAALIPTEGPIDRWWTELADADAAKVHQLAAVSKRPNKRRRTLQPCGTHAAFVRHKARGEKPCTACSAAERQYHHARHLRRYATDRRYRTRKSA